MSKPFELLVFDWDGTLMDSEARIVACMQGAADDLDLPIPDEASVRNIIGLGLGEAIATIFPEIDQDFITRMINQYRHHFLVTNKTPSSLFEGVEAVLTELQENAYMMAVATGKGRQGLDKVLDETGLGHFFMATRCADEGFSKPHPGMMLEIMDELGVQPSDALMVGDTDYDLQMAHNAETKSLAVSYGVHESERLMAQKPLGMIHDIRELTDWLKNLDMTASEKKQTI